MSVTTEPAGDLLERTRRTAHPSCIVCGRADECGLGLRFSVQQDGGVVAHFACRRHLQGYEGILHGGIVSALLDGAMTNCLFAHGITAVTGEMTIRFRHPIRLRTAVTVCGRIARSQWPLHVAEAQIVQDGRVMAKARGKFMERSQQAGDPPPPTGWPQRPAQAPPAGTPRPAPNRGDG